DEKGVLAADQIADPSEDEGAEWTCRKARRKGEQSENEANGGSNVGKEEFGKKHAQSAIDIEVVPFEHGPERGSEDDEPLLRTHAAPWSPDRARREGRHGRSALLWCTMARQQLRGLSCSRCPSRNNCAPRREPLSS